MSMTIFSVIPGAFQSAVHGVVVGKDYKTGVETTFRAGGCNASRGGFIGACLATQVHHIHVSLNIDSSYPNNRILKSSKIIVNRLVLNDCSYLPTI